MSCENHSHTCHCTNQTATQSLEELDFFRGIWNASREGDVDRVRTLVEKNNYTVDQKDAAGYTPLHYAARNGHESVCQYLLSRGADVNARTKAGGATALHRACSAGQHQMVCFLLKAGADANLQDGDGKTALHRAALVKREDICQILCERYPHLKDMVDNKGEKPQWEQ